MIIRKAESQDFEEVFGLLHEFIKEHRKYDKHYYALLPGPEFKKKFRARFMKYPRSRSQFFLVAEDQGVIVGTVRGEVQERHPGFRSEKQGYISQLMTRKSHRGQGIALQLMAEALKRFRAKKIKRAVLRVDAGNLPAKKLYSKLDFCDRQVIMTKYL